MILHPSILALLLASGLNSFLLLYAGWYGLVILRRFDLRSGSALQLELERRTSLISALLVWVCVFQLCSLFLYVFTVDRLAPLFTGAMCAAGTLNVNGYGYPVLGLKLANFLLAGIWLILNRADRQAEDYPLIRVTYGLLLAMLPLVLAEALLQLRFFTGLAPDVITSCCGSLFSGAGVSVSSDIAALPARPTMLAWYGAAAAVTVTGVVFYLRGTAGYVFAAASAGFFFLTLAAVLSFISIYAYELPSHHCPFCLLQAAYGSRGYALYAAALCAAVSGAGVGALMPFRTVASLRGTIPRLQKSLCLLSLVADLVLVSLVTAGTLASNLKL